jgi:hypothetical protein
MDETVREKLTMSTTEKELASFNEFARNRISIGQVPPPLDELFELWRLEHPSDELYAENVAAVGGAINDFRNGDRGSPAGEHSEHLRRTYGLDDQ